MISYSVVLFYLFLNPLLSSKGIGGKIFGVKGAKETPLPRNSTNKSPSILSMAG